MTLSELFNNQQGGSSPLMNPAIPQTSQQLGNQNLANAITNQSITGNTNFLDTLKGLFGGGETSTGLNTGADSGLGSGLGMNIGTGQLALGGLQALAGLWGAQQANSLARDQFKFTKDYANTNLTNQIQSYNTALTDRANTRAVMEGRDQASAQRYIDEHKLSR